jgi:hypothetical protein
MKGRMQVLIAGMSIFDNAIPQNFTANCILTYLAQRKLFFKDI